MFLGPRSEETQFSTTRAAPLGNCPRAPRQTWRREGRGGGRGGCVGERKGGRREGEGRGGLDLWWTHPKVSFLLSNVFVQVSVFSFLNLCGTNSKVLIVFFHIYINTYVKKLYCLIQFLNIFVVLFLVVSLFVFSSFSFFFCFCFCFELSFLGLFSKKKVLGVVGSCGRVGCWFGLLGVVLGRWVVFSFQFQFSVLGLVLTFSQY